ncbi:hypothetical protein [Desulfospira joergensenii]|uniref:hypothetical protein n=1 Tax=Desulfospira joergensenii TaxID=53329 RepID=UPI0004269A49|nr:hypothetical protein [Desulfospira joergensenii]
MKISRSDIVLSSNGSAEQMNLNLEERSSSRVLAGSLSRREGVLEAGSPIALTDRVSISGSRQDQFQSNYSARIESSSKVENSKTGETGLFEHQDLMETLVGAVIDQKAVVRRIRQGRAVSMDGGKTGAGFSGSRVREFLLERTSIHYEEEQASFSSTGSVVTEDGRTISFSLDLALDRASLSETREETRIRMEQMQVVDPLVISLDHGLPSLSDLTFEFDLDNDGEMDRVHSTSPGSGFLALDKNNDMEINNGSELFGPGTGNGFEELAAYDGDNNNWIDENDAIFGQLKVWTRDENGEDRLITLKEAGLGAIYLENASSGFDLKDSNDTLKGRVKSSGMFLFENGDVGSVQQIDLAKLEKGSDQGSPAQSFFKPGTLGGEAGDPVDDSSSEAGLSSMIARRFGPADFFPFVNAPEQVDTPLEQLLKEIQELKKGMEDLLNPGQGKRNRPGHQFYRMMDPGSSFAGRGFSRRAWF